MRFQWRVCVEEYLAGDDEVDRDFQGNSNENKNLESLQNSLSKKNAKRREPLVHPQRQIWLQQGNHFIVLPWAQTAFGFCLPPFWRRKKLRHQKSVQSDYCRFRTNIFLRKILNITALQHATLMMSGGLHFMRDDATVCTFPTTTSLGVRCDSKSFYTVSLLLHVVSWIWDVQIPVEKPTYGANGSFPSDSWFMCLPLVSSVLQDHELTVRGILEFRQ